MSLGPCSSPKKQVFLADDIDASTYMILRWLSFVGECMRVGVSSETLCVAGVEICNTE